MKIKSIAAVGALGVGLGLAGLVGAGAASADPCNTTPPFSPERVACVAAQNGQTFINTTNPAYNLDQLLNSGVDSNDNPVGLTHWGSTFQSSVGDFLNGPRAPEDPTAPAAP